MFFVCLFDAIGGTGAMNMCLAMGVLLDTVGRGVEAPGGGMRTT